MRKKVLSAVLAATMVAGMMGNVVSVSAEEKYDLTLYSVNTTDPDFDDWLAKDVYKRQDFGHGTDTG